MPIHSTDSFRAALKSSASFGWAKAGGVGVLLALPLLGAPAFANPLSGAVTTGSASVSSASNKTTIDQKSEDVVIDWSSFNIGAGQTTQFVQPNAQAIAVNRIGGNSASQILGTLDANGRIVLINGNGMLFGKGSQVNVGSLVATSTGGSDSDVLSGKFTQAGNPNAAIVNNGRITTSQGGLVALVAPNVSNAGTVNAKFGTVAVGAANKFTVDFSGDGLVSFAAQGDVNSKATATNTGSLVGANVSLTAHAAEGVATGVVTMSGIVTAQTAKNIGGTILLDAGDGALSMTGTLNAAGTTGGGNIETSGNQVAISGTVTAGQHGNWKVDPENLTIDASAATTIDNALNSGTSVTEQTTSGAASGSGNQSPGAGNIIVASALSWRSTATLTLDAYSGINIDARIKVNNSGGLDLVTNDGGTGGLLTFAPGDAVVFSHLTSALTINGAAYTLVDNIAALSGDITANPAGDFALANTYNAAADGTYAGSPITTAFSGAFNGLGNTIESLRISDSVANDTVGLFGTLDGSVASLALTGVKIVGGTGAFVGAVAGTDNGAIAGVTVSGSVIGGKNADVGGLVGIGTGAVAYSSTSGTVTGGLGATIGGLIGDNASGSSAVSNSFSSANVTGGANAGGLAGLNAGTIEDSDATGAVSGGNLVGGLVGDNQGLIGASFASGAVGGGGDVGGLVGLNASGGTIANAFAMGPVQGGEDVGGLVGENDWQITASYATGPVSGVARSFIGGIVGADLTVDGIASSYWDTTTSGFYNLSQGAGNLANDSGIAGDTTAQLQAALPGGFSKAAWATLPNLAFPYLKWQAPSGTPQVISGTFTGSAGSAIDVLVDGTQITPLVSMHTMPNDYYYLLLAPGAMPEGSDVLVYDAGMTGARLISMTSSSLANFNFVPGTLLQYTRDDLYSAMAGELETAIGANVAVQSFIDAIPNYDLTSTASSFTIDQPLDIFTRTVIADSAGYLTIATAQDLTSPSALTLQGSHALKIDDTVAVNGTGGLNIVGQLDFNGGNITFADLSDSFTINGKPYTLVDTLAQMAAAALSGNNIALANNYDASADGTYSTSPVASALNIGVQGLGNTISNLSIDDSSGANVGLFANVKHGLIENLSLVNETIAAVGNRHRAWAAWWV